jgi:hypothetical protein
LSEDKQRAVFIGFAIPDSFNPFTDCMLFIGKDNFIDRLFSCFFFCLMFNTSWFRTSYILNM